MPETTEQKCESRTCSPIACPMCEAATRFPHLIRAILLVFSAVVLAAMANQFHPRGLPWRIPADGRTGIPRAFAGRMPEVSPKAAFAMWEAGGVTFLDSRKASDYRKDHLPDAVSAPMEEWEKVRPGLPRDGKYVLYCDGLPGGLSTRQAKRMLELGYQHLAVLGGGWVEWRKAGGPTEKHPEKRPQ